MNSAPRTSTMRKQETRRELDGFDAFEPFAPPDITNGEHIALIDLWRRLGGRRWLRGEKWRYSDAYEWEGVTVKGGEEVLAMPEEKLMKSPTAKPYSGPKLRRGDPKFHLGEEVLVKAARFERSAEQVEEGAAWVEGDPLRPARITVVSIRGKGVHQYVEYDCRYSFFELLGLSSFELTAYP